MNVPLNIVLLVLGGAGLAVLLWRLIRAMELSARRTLEAAEYNKVGLEAYVAAVGKMETAMQNNGALLLELTAAMKVVAQRADQAQNALALNTASVEGLYKAVTSMKESELKLLEAVTISCEWMSTVDQRMEWIGNGLSGEAEKLRAGLAPAVDALKASSESMPRLMEALAKIGSAQLELLQSQRAVEEDRRRYPFGKPNQARPDAGASEQEYEVQQMMRAEGVSREEALLRMNPANGHGVWEGNQIFQGWR